MRIVARVLAALSFTSLVLACESTSSPSNPDAGGTIVPMDDGATCACASPDCLPNCSQLPACKLVCQTSSSGAVLAWVDPCGGVQYSQACANGCADAAACQ
jgi:hypothetical protein